MTGSDTLGLVVYRHWDPVLNRYGRSAITTLTTAATWAPIRGSRPPLEARLTCSSDVEAIAVARSAPAATAFLVRMPVKGDGIGSRSAQERSQAARGSLGNSAGRG